ncbi:MAG: DNA internalization-related competence protein ComEC/Rec2 [Moraxellaceae bacterium]|nr:DNA internalization-related competence protein ComEC/Rec2 [Moraxellaceae bacterium]
MWQFAYGWVLGISLLWVWPVLPSLRYVLLFMAILALGHRLSSFRGLVLLFYGLGLGITWSTYHADQQLNRIVSPSCEQQRLDVAGTVLDISSPLSLRGSRFLFAPDISEHPCLQQPQRWMLNYWQDEPVLPGSRWQFQLRLKQPYGNANPAGFDAERFWHHQGVDAIASSSQGKVLQEPPASVALLRWHIRQLVLTAFADRPQAAGMMLALMTGDRAGIDPVAKAHYAQAGISHLLAISGLHIGLIAGFAAGLSSLFLRRCPYLLSIWPLSRWTGMVAFTVALAYGVLAGLQVPTQRALLMLLVLIALRWLPLVVSALQSLLLALCVVLLWDPLAVLSEGLWLSFTAVGLLMWGGLRLGEETPLSAMLRAQWLATWGLLPITVAFFARFSVIGLLVNLVAIPLVSILVLPLALIGLLICLMSPSWAVIWWQLPIFLLHYLNRSVAWLTELPHAFIDLHLPPMLLASLALTALLLLMPKAMPGRLLLLLPLLSLAWPQPGIAPKQVQITVLDVGQGSAVVVSTANHHLLYDTGPPYGEFSDAGARVVVPYLSWRGISGLDMVMLSHDDADHVGGFVSLLARIKVKKVLGVWPSAVTKTPDSPPQRPCYAGQSWLWDDVRFDVLWPPQGQRITKKNDQSCVLRIEAMGQVVLIPGDLEALGELYLLEQVPTEVLAADILLLGHHGSRSSTGPRFLATVNPKVAIASMGYLNRYRHPAKVVVDRLAEHGVLLLQSDVEGAITLTLNRSNQPPEISSWRYLRRHYWMANWRQNYLASKE